MAQDRSTHDPKTGRKTGSVALSGKEVPKPQILGKVEPAWDGDENPYKVAYTRFEEAHLADIVEGTISFTSTPEIEKAIEASEKAFIATLDDDGKLDWILLSNAPILEALQGNTGHLDSLFRKMAHFAGAWKIMVRVDKVTGVRTYNIDLNEHWHNGTEDFIRHIASLGMGVEGQFKGEGDETWTYHSVLGSGILEVDDETRNTKTSLTEEQKDSLLEDARQASDIRWESIIREQTEALNRAQLVYDNAMVVASGNSNRKERNSGLIEAEETFRKAQVDVEKIFNASCAESKAIFDAEIDRIRTL
jgi:hypothetical protein